MYIKTYPFLNNTNIGTEESAGWVSYLIRINQIVKPHLQ